MRVPPAGYRCEHMRTEWCEQKRAEGGVHFMNCSILYMSVGFHVLPPEGMAKSRVRHQFSVFSYITTRGQAFIALKDQYIGFKSLVLYSLTPEALIYQ